jgi:CRISPR-associated protein Cmr3
MQGIVRSILLLTYCKDTKKFGTGKCNDCPERNNCQLPAVLGSSKDGDYGELTLSGPYLYKDGVRFYQAPLDLMREKEGIKRLFSLSPSDKPTACDLGNVCLPTKSADKGYGAFDIAGGWIREDALKDYLMEYKIPEGEEKLLSDKDLFEKEPKVGIKRDYSTHRVDLGMLYSTVPSRLRKGVKIGLRVKNIEGLSENLPQKFITKIGGEGKLCKVEILEDPKEILIPTLAPGTKKIRMLLLQPAYFEEEQASHWHPPGFKKVKCDSFDCWEGCINGVKARIVSACIGRPQKVGGWDMANKRVRPMRSFVPAGSVYFVEVIEGNLPSEGGIGKDTNIGLGHYLLGRWKDV